MINYYKYKRFSRVTENFLLENGISIQKMRDTLLTLDIKSKNYYEYLKTPADVLYLATMDYK
mgnify:CR=1 FL=1